MLQIFFFFFLPSNLYSVFPSKNLIVFLSRVKQMELSISECRCLLSFFGNNVSEKRNRQIKKQLYIQKCEKLFRLINQWCLKSCQMFWLLPRFFPHKWIFSYVLFSRIDARLWFFYGAVWIIIKRKLLISNYWKYL